MKIGLKLLILCGISLWAQYPIPKAKNPILPVYNQSEVLSKQQEQFLNKTLIDYAKKTSTEILLVVIPSTLGEDDYMLATHWGEAWKIGQKNKDNGIVFLIAVNDRSVSIQAGRGLSQYLTAGQTGEIIDYFIVPHFKKGHYFEGIQSGLNQIFLSLEGKYSAPQNLYKKQEKQQISGFWVFLIIAVILLIISIFNNKNGKGPHSKNTDGGWMGFPMIGGRRGGGFGSSGGGFGGFGGGGSFGGSGASGRW